jgi:hypothetical protein
LDYPGKRSVAIGGGWGVYPKGQSSQPHRHNYNLKRINRVDYEWLKSVIAVVAQHGPWALLAWYLVTKLLELHKQVQDLLVAAQVAVTENARITERLAVLIEERTRRVTNGQ